MNKKLIIFLSFIFSLVILLTLTFYFFPRNNNKDNNNSQESLIQEEEKEEENEENKFEEENKSENEENLNNSQENEEKNENKNEENKSEEENKEGNENEEEISMNLKHQIISLILTTGLSLVFIPFILYLIIVFFIEKDNLSSKNFFIINFIFFIFCFLFFQNSYCSVYSGSKKYFKLFKNTFFNKWWKIILIVIYIVFFSWLSSYLTCPYLLNFFSGGKDKTESENEDEPNKNQNE